MPHQHTAMTRGYASEAFAASLLALSVLLSPAIVARYVSSDGSLLASTVQALNTLRVVIGAAGVLGLALAVVARRWPQLDVKFTDLLLTRVGLTVLAVAALLYVFSGIKDNLNVHDEGAWVYEPTRILNGDVPYRDYWAKDAPGQSYALALLFKLFGTSLIVERIYARALHFILVLCAFLLASRLVPRKFALVSSLLLALWIKTFDFSSGYPVVPAAVLSLAACLAIAEYLEKQRSRWLLAAGVLTGVATVFRHDIGAYTAVAASVTIVLSSRHHPFREWSVYCASVATVVVPVGVYFVVMVGMEELVTNLFEYPLFIYSRYRSLPVLAPIPNVALLYSGEMRLATYGLATLERAQFYAPPAVFITGAILLWFSRVKREEPAARRYLLILLLILGTLGLNQVRSRWDVGHLFPAMLITVVLLPWLLHVASRRGRAVMAAACLGVVVLTASICVPRVISWIANYGMQTAPLHLERAEGIHLLADEAEHLQKAVTFVQSHVRPEEKIYVGTATHRRLYSTHIMFYFLTQRHSATKFHTLEPGVVNTHAIQSHMIGELERQKVRYVVLWTHEQFKEPNESARDSGVEDLDRYIQERYAVDQVFGDYTILRRNGA
jgi:hypothetical protein